MPVTSEDLEDIKRFNDNVLDKFMSRVVYDGRRDDTTNLEWLRNEGWKHLTMFEQYTLFREYDESR